MVTYLFSFSDHINIKCCEQVLKAELEDQEKSLKAAVALQEMPYGFLKNAAVEVTDRKIAYIRFLSEYFWSFLGFGGILGMILYCSFGLYLYKYIWDY